MSQPDRTQLLAVVGFAVLLVSFVTFLDRPGSDHPAWAYPRDSKGERPIVALWTESFADPDGDDGKRLVLAIWENGDVLWRNELKPTSSPLVHHRISPDAARTVQQNVAANLRDYSDPDPQSVFFDEATMVLGFIDVDGQHRVSTSHTMAPDLPTILKLRFRRIVVEDDAMRERFRARFTPHELAFISHWDAAMNAIMGALREPAHASASPRVIRWPGSR